MTPQTKLKDQDKNRDLQALSVVVFELKSEKLFRVFLSKLSICYHMSRNVKSVCMSTNVQDLNHAQTERSLFSVRRPSSS